MLSVAASGYGPLLALVVLTTAGLTGLVRRYALHAGLIDLPGARRSHASVTPRGGGVAIALVSMAAFGWLAACGRLPVADAWALCGAGALVAVTGFIDDHRPLAARWRLPVHLLAAGWALYWSGPAGTVMAAMLVVFALAWLLNLYNFMDGIDTMAALQAIVICLAGALLHAVSGHPDRAVAPLVLAAASAGFLYWNLPPARIFLGDAGSGFLGITIGILALQAGRTDPALLAGWIILTGVFLMDASVTLLRRILRRERIWVAHREHAYQHLARRCGSHWPVSAGFALVTALWSTPWAVLVALRWIEPWAGVLAGCLPLGGIAWRLRASRPEAAGRAASTIEIPEFP